MSKCRLVNFASCCIKKSKNIQKAINTFLQKLRKKFKLPHFVIIKNIIILVLANFANSNRPLISL